MSVSSASGVRANPSVLTPNLSCRSSGVAAPPLGSIARSSCSDEIGAIPRFGDSRRRPPIWGERWHRSDEPLDSVAAADSSQRSAHEVAASALYERSEQGNAPTTDVSLPSLITRFVLLSLAAVALAVLRPASRTGTRVEKPRRRRSGVRRIAVSLSFATLFFAGAAFSAGAGDVVANLVEQQAVTAAQAPAEATAADEAECSRPDDWQFEEYSDEPECETEAPADEAATGEAAAPVPGDRRAGGRRARGRVALRCRTRRAGCNR